MPARVTCAHAGRRVEHACRAGERTTRPSRRQATHTPLILTSTRRSTGWRCRPKSREPRRPPQVWLKLAEVCHFAHRECFAKLIPRKTSALLTISAIDVLSVTFRTRAEAEALHKPEGVAIWIVELKTACPPALIDESLQGLRRS